MPSANKTPNYNLTQYSNNGSDKISALRDYNEDMSKIDTAINQNANAIATKADSDTTYSKTDIDSKLATKANTSDMTDKLATKADTATTYTKVEVDEKVDLKADDTDVYTKNDIDQKNKEISLNTYRHGNGLHAVFIGDSITQGYQASDNAHRWSTLLSQKFGWTEHNYAVGGTGFINAGPNNNARYDQQCATAAADSSYDHSKVTAIFVTGGVNDSAPSNITAGNAAVFSCINTLQNTFPNAQIYAGVGISGSLDPNKHGLGQTPLISRIDYYTELERTFGSQNIILIPSMWEWIYYEENWQNDDSVHPNDLGYARIASLMTQVVNGTYGKTQSKKSFARYYDNNYGPKVTRHSFVVNVIGSVVHFFGDIDITIPNGDPAIGTRTITTDVFYFPAWFRVKYPSYRPIVNKVLVDIAGPITYQNVKAINGQYSMSVIATTTILPSTTATFNAGDKITLYFDCTYPAIGLAS